MTIFKEDIREKSNIFCPCCGHKKVYWVDEEIGDYTHYCKWCEETFTCKGSTYIT